MKLNPKVGLALAMFVVATLCSVSMFAATKTTPELDPFGVEPLNAICNMREGAPISDKCYGFVAGVTDAFGFALVARVQTFLLAGDRIIQIKDAVSFP